MLIKSERECDPFGVVSDPTKRPYEPEESRSIQETRPPIPPLSIPTNNCLSPDLLSSIGDDQSPSVGPDPDGLPSPGAPFPLSLGKRVSPPFFFFTLAFPCGRMLAPPDVRYDAPPWE